MGNDLIYATKLIYDNFSTIYLDQWRDTCTNLYNIFPMALLGEIHQLDLIEEKFVPDVSMILGLV